MLVTWLDYEKALPKSIKQQDKSVAEDLHIARETKKQQRAVGTLNWIVISMDVEHQLRCIGYQ